MNKHKRHLGIVRGLQERKTSLLKEQQQNNNPSICKVEKISINKNVNEFLDIGNKCLDYTRNSVYKK